MNIYALAAILILAFVTFVLCSHTSNRNRHKLKIGETFTYTAETYPSVGYSFHADYDDKEAFKEKYSVKYEDPESIEDGMCGADKGMTTLTLRAQKKGKFTVKIIHTFRGKVEKELTLKFSVR